MQKISIRDFGPLKNVTTEVKDLLLFIGPQASGKSTARLKLWKERPEKQ